MYDPDLPDLAPRRRWPVTVPLVLFILIAAAWSGLWFYAASTAEQRIEGWRAREAKAGRIFGCGTQSIGGYPFRIEVRCTNPTAEIRSQQPNVVLKARDLLVAAQIYEPNLLISEFTGPLSIGEPNREPTIVADWKLAQTSVRGTPKDPERVSIVFDEPRFQRVRTPVAETVLTAHHMEVHGRMISGSAAANPVIQLGLRLVAASAPGLTPLAMQPIDAEISGVMRGLKDFSAKPWSARLRELQASGGKLDIVSARVTQGDILAVGSGTLGLSPSGRLDGQLNLTIAGIGKLLTALGIDRVPAEGESDQLAPAVNALDRIVPGLGSLARKHAGSALAVGLGLLGQPTELEGQPAAIVPLRFADGVAFLGPLKLGQTPPLY